MGSKKKQRARKHGLRGKMKLFGIQKTKLTGVKVVDKNS